MTNTFLVTWRLSISLLASICCEQQTRDGSHWWNLGNILWAKKVYCACTKHCSHRRRFQLSVDQCGKFTRTWMQSSWGTTSHQTLDCILKWLDFGHSFRRFQPLKLVKHSLFITVKAPLSGKTHSEERSWPLCHILHCFLNVLWVFKTLQICNILRPFLETFWKVLFYFVP